MKMTAELCCLNVHFLRALYFLLKPSVSFGRCFWFISIFNADLSDNVPVRGGSNLLFFKFKL